MPKKKEINTLGARTEQKNMYSILFEQVVNVS